MAIIGILVSMMLPVVSRVYRKAKATAEEVEEPEVAERLQRAVFNYCAGHAQYEFVSKTDFLNKCVLPPKCHQWVETSYTDFVPFNYLDSTNKLVITFHFGNKYAHTDYFTKGSLTVSQ